MKVSNLYNDLNNNYNNDNDLNAHIIIKNLEESYIPENRPFINKEKF